MRICSALKLQLAALAFFCVLDQSFTQLEEEECQANLTQDGLCQRPGTAGGPISTAVVYETELEAALVARCYAICAQNNTTEVRSGGGGGGDLQITIRIETVFFRLDRWLSTMAFGNR